MMDYGMGWGFGGFWMLLFWLVPLLLVVLGVKFLFLDGARRGNNDLSQKGLNQPHSDRALATLQERYARGEIDREEFLQKRDDILGK